MKSDIRRIKHIMTILSACVAVLLFVVMICQCHLAYNCYLQGEYDLKYPAIITDITGMKCKYSRYEYEMDVPMSPEQIGSEVFVTDYSEDKCDIYYNDGHGIEWVVEDANVCQILVNTDVQDYFYRERTYSETEYLLRVIKYRFKSVTQNIYSSIDEYMLWAVSRRLFLALLLSIAIILLDFRSSQKWMNIVFGVCVLIQTCLLLLTVFKIYLII